VIRFGDRKCIRPVINLLHKSQWFVFGWNYILKQINKKCVSDNYYYYLFIISVVHEVQKRQKERQDRTDRTSASTQIMDKNMHNN